MLAAYARTPPNQGHTGVKQVIRICRQGSSMPCRSYADSLIPVACQYSDRYQMPRRGSDALRPELPASWQRRFVQRESTEVRER